MALAALALMRFKLHVMLVIAVSALAGWGLHHWPALV
jgi:hypothetical protein